MTESVSLGDRARLLDIYLDDHWAGAGAGSALAERLADENAGTVWGVDLARVADQIRSDEEVLSQIRAHFRSNGGAIKRAGALIGERLSRIKPNGRFLRYSPLSRVLELEALISGVTAKQRLWVALQQTDQGSLSLGDFDLLGLEIGAREQLVLLCSIHEAASGEAFGGQSPKT